MGAGQSTAGSVLGAAHAALLERLAGPEPIPLAAPFWDQLFSLQVPLASLDPAEVELALAPHCRQLREWRRFGRAARGAARRGAARRGAARRGAAQQRGARRAPGLAAPGRSARHIHARGRRSSAAAAAAPSLPLRPAGSAVPGCPRRPANHPFPSLPPPPPSHPQPADAQLPVPAAARHGAARGRAGRCAVAARGQRAAPYLGRAQNHRRDGGAEHASGGV
jgi:hypothetical protein